MIRSCDFCMEFGNSAQASAGASKRPAWMSKSLVVAPTVGPLRQGHMLLLPIEHVTSLGRVTVPTARELLTVIDEVKSLLKERFGSIISFEHGTTGEERAGGCGIDHAHVHFLPLPTEIEGLPPVPGAAWAALGGNWLEDLQRLSAEGQPYVYFETQSRGRYVTTATSLPSQFMRRWVAEQIGLTTWDWRESTPASDYADAAAWMRNEMPPIGFVTLGELAEATT